MAITIFDEIRGLFSGFGINDTAESGWLAGLPFRHSPRVCDHTDKNAADTSRTADHLLRKISLKFVESFRIKKCVEDGAHIIRCPMIIGQDIVEFVDRRAW